MSQTRNGFVFQAQPKVTGNSQKNNYNSVVKKWGYSRYLNPNPETDGDHVMEKQLGGPDSYDNVWPLNSSTNRTSGSHVRNEIDRIVKDNKLKKIEGTWLKLKL
jgi:hypothetical protein